MQERPTTRGSRASAGREDEVLAPSVVEEGGEATTETLAPARADEPEALLSPVAKPSPHRKGLLVDVLRPAHAGDNTNFGVSSKHIKFVLVGDEVAGETVPTPEAPALELIRRGEYLHAEPPGSVPVGCVGYMFGGNFVWSSDTLFPNDYPIPVHDRLETQEQHDMLTS